MNFKELSKEHKKYAMIYLADDAQSKLKGEYAPGCKVEILWHLPDGEEYYKIIDKGYAFHVGGMDTDCGDFFIHVPCSENPGGKGDGDEIWVHVNNLLINKLVRKVILKP
jgi:hypothetical protein